jgi:hypothetical protein
MAILCKLTGHALQYPYGDCRGYCVEQVGMTTTTLNDWAGYGAIPYRKIRV